MNTLRFTPLLILTLVGCDAPPPSSMTDAGRTEDAGLATQDAGPVGSDAGPIGSDAGPIGPVDAGPIDGGAVADAGPIPDAGPISDAGPILDAGPLSDAGPPSDAGPIDAGPPTLVCGTPHLIVSAADPTGSVWIFNPSTSSIATDGYLLEYDSTRVTLGASMTVAPGGQVMLPWPSAFPTSTAGGELSLLAPTSEAAPLDYICWGTGVAGSVSGARARAEGRWSGTCTDALIGAGYPVSRRQNTDGLTRDSYEAFSLGPEVSCP